MKLGRGLEECVNQLASKAVEQMRQDNSQTSDRVANHNNDGFPDHQIANKTNQPNDRCRVSSDKVFVARESLLTELMETPHIRLIYRVFIVTFIILFLNTVICDLMDKGSIDIGFGLIQFAFGKMGTVLYIWTCMQMASLLPHPLLTLWATNHQFLLQFGYKVVQVWDIAWLCVFIAFQVTLLVLPVIAILKYNLPIVSSFIILLEMIRFVMKIHSYVRSVSPRALHPLHRNTAIIPLPPFSCYLYFLFAPTLIYRDSYPRTGHTRWGVVAVRLLEIVVIIFFKSFLYEHTFIANFSNIGKTGEVLEVKQFVPLIFGSMLPSLMIFLCGFYLLLHCWLNATAEALKFADRQFYTDWWNQSNYGSFFRTWNVVIHDWLYTYIYKDVLILTGNRLLSTLLVFELSAIIHEFVLSFIFGFFYPVLLVMFGVLGVLIVFLTKQSNSSVGNIFMWCSLVVGNSIMFSLYCAEYYARKNCPASEDTGPWDALIPRSWSCHHNTF